MRKLTKFRHLCIWISVILVLSLVLPVQADNGDNLPVQADAGDSLPSAGTQDETKTETQLIIVNGSAAQENKDSASTASVSGLKITVDPLQQTDPEKEPGSEVDPQDSEELSKVLKEDGELVEEIGVISREEISWQIPVFWVTPDHKTVRKGTPGEDCLPVLAFFVPEEYAVSDQTDAGFVITLDPYLSGLYKKAGGAVCIYDPNTGITYILPDGMDAGLLDAITGKGKEPDQEIPGLPEELKKPDDGTYNNPATSGSETEEKEEEESGNNNAEEQEDPKQREPEETTEEKKSSEEIPAETPEEEVEEEEPSNDETDTSLTKEQLLGHCSKTALNCYDEDELAAFVNLIITSIQPQAVNLIRTKFPAFAAAAESNELGKELGLYVYRMYGDKDGVDAHEAAAPGVMAYVGYEIYRDENKEAQLSYVLGINLADFETADEDGNRHISTTEQAVADIDNTLIHEMLHGFMYDYNRTGSIGTNDPNDYFKSAARLRRIKNTYAFPSWFEEGIASSVENVYQFRYEAFQLMRYEGEGVIGDRYTAENLLKTYTTTTFILENGQEHKDVYDLEDPDKSVTSTYVTGYLADLYLGEMAAQYADLGSSVTVDDEGNRKVSSETIRMGLNSILARMHNGESLDEVICSISGGAYQNTADFEKKFIKGTDNLGDSASISFVVDYLNYMQEIGKTSTKIPNGSILFDFAQDYTSPIDRTVTASESIYQITDSSDYVDSTVTPKAPYTDGGKSKGSVVTLSTAAVSNTATASAAAEDEESGQDTLLAAKVSGEEALPEESEGINVTEAETEPAPESSDESLEETAGSADDTAEAEEPAEEAEQNEAAQEEQNDAAQDEQNAAAEQAAEETSVTAEESEPAEETSEPEEQEEAEEPVQETAETSGTGETAEEAAEQEE